MKSKKGQISIEFMLIILVCLGYLQLLTVNVLEPAIDSAQDITRLSQAKLSADKLAATINEMSSSLGEGKRTLHLFVPKDSLINCGTVGIIGFSVELYGNATTECPLHMSTPMCVMPIAVNLDASDTCNVFIDGGEKGAFREVSISKNAFGNITVS